MRLFSWIERSFSARASLYVIGIVGLMFVATFFVTHRFSVKTIQDSVMTGADLTVTNAVAEINEVLSRVSGSVDNIRLIVQREDIPIDSLYGVVRDFVAANEDIVGSAIAFAPNHYPSKGYYFSPYAYRSGDKIEIKQLGTADYDYFNMEWYQMPSLLDRDSYWTEPYYDKGGGGTAMCTYAAAMTDKDGRFLGVVTADISLDWMTDLVLSIKPFPNTQSFVLGREGTYLVHSLRDMKYNESILSQEDSEKKADDVLTLAGEKMINGEKGYLTMHDEEGEMSFVFYAPVSQVGWSLAMINTADDVFDDVYESVGDMIAFTLLGMLLIFVCCVYIIRKVTKPLVLFAESAKRIAQGEFNAQLPVIKSKDEMMVLRDSFVYMKEELASYVSSMQEMAKARGRLESEMRIASSIQLGMVPKVYPPFPERADIDLCGVLRPAKEVGGDLFDFFIEDEVLYFSLGDVSGKGVPASLFMAGARSMFHNIASRVKSAKNIVGRMNEAMLEHNDESMFITLIVGAIDLNKRVMTFCNAGHNPFCLIDTDRHVSFVEVDRNIPIGLLPDMPYTEQTLELKAGQTLFFYTDGITEAENPQQELYGEEMLLEVLHTHSSADDMKMLLEEVSSSVIRHASGAAQSDDFAMLAIKLLEKPAAPAGEETPAQPVAEERRDAAAGDCSRLLVIKNVVPELSRLSGFVEDVCESACLSPGLTMSLNLVMEEMVSNVVLYAYPKGENNCDIEISGTWGDDIITFTIEDTGKFYDPTAKEDVDITLSAEERPIGGLGIHLARQIMDTMHYQRVDGRNILTMTKKLNKEH